MSIRLGPEHEQLIAQAIETGAYRTADEVIERALGMLRFEEEWLPDQKDEITEKIARAFGRFDRGEYFSAKESRDEMGRRKAAWFRERH
ncbi:MAG: type II toxin-antitoxin system ParD family antitoxin [Bryobacteraceae bacterium]